jgi:peptidoglycan/xylan/chitin deacetylase (PgdA/CDA1 family)
VVRFASVRSRLKAGFEAAAVHSGMAGLSRRRLKRRGLILAYHGIVPNGERPAGERTLHLPESQFHAQLDVLGALTSVVPLDELLGPSDSVGLLPRAAITWDDAYLGALTTGVDAVVRRGLPATIFVAPGRLGGQSFWWDRLAERFGGTIPGAIRSRALRELAGVDEAVAAEYERDAPPASIPDFARTGGETLLAGAAARPGISVASHSWSHANLAAIPPARLEQELTSPADWLGERFTTYLACLAYPYGLDSPEVRRRSGLAGYVAGLRVEGGWMAREEGDRFQVPRLNIPAGLSLDGFVLRLSGLLSR